jgi:hypothetical protein
MLKVKDKLLSPLKEYFEDGQFVASFDGGPGTLIFANGKEFSFSLWSPEWVEKPVLPKGSAKIACIVDFHHEVVANEASADKIIYSNGSETTYYKEGELEVVAHSETPLDGSSGIIVCNKNNYKVIRSKTRLGFSVSEIYDDDHSIAIIKDKLVGAKSIFKNDLPLSDRVFITHLSFNWWHDER